MNDEQILKQLLSGRHLEPKEIERAKQLVKTLTIHLKQQKP